MANTKKNGPDEPTPNTKNKVFAAFGLAASLGVNLAACILVGAAAGKFADGFFGTLPWLTVAGIVVGTFSGMWVIYKKVINFEK